MQRFVPKGLSVLVVLICVVMPFFLTASAAAGQIDSVYGPLPVFELHSGFWINLHHRLYQEARVQRSAVNTQCKLLLLTHAFEKLDCIAVEFRTHFFNHASRRGIERLGAKLDGILRNHSIAPNGTLRDTVVYSVIGAEWPTVRAHLNYQLNEKAR